jgi:hypothetical protein
MLDHEASPRAKPLVQAGQRLPWSALQMGYRSWSGVSDVGCLMIVIGDRKELFLNAT